MYFENGDKLALTNLPLIGDVLDDGYVMTVIGNKRENCLHRLQAGVWKLD